MLYDIQIPIPNNQYSKLETIPQILLIENIFIIIYNMYFAFR